MTMTNAQAALIAAASQIVRTGDNDVLDLTEDSRTLQLAVCYEMWLDSEDRLRAEDTA